MRTSVLTDQRPHSDSVTDPGPGVTDDTDDGRVEWTTSSRPSAARRSMGIVLLAAAVGLAVLLSLAVGAKSMPWSTVVDAVMSYDSTNTDHLIVRELRLPRTVLGLLVGAALGAAGALMQGVTRNPLADPGLLGVNAGAAFAVVLAIWGFGITSVSGMVWFAFVGAGIASVAVYVLGSAGRGNATPVRLALAGAALAALLFALTRAVTLLDQATLDQFRFWAVGSLGGRGTDVAGQVVVFIAIGLVLAIGVARHLNALALGEETATALGTKIAATRTVSVIAITLLCGSAVAAAGPIGFVGLVVPHAVRAWFGPDQRWLLPASALAGAAFLLYCDTLGRVLARPGEVQVGIMTAAIGGPVFIVLVRRTRMAQL
ncbi:FecCD family ABC transporter permease [Ilumatobacter nonamiensis]|uniref:FecCD family ABC transporter permease n=1 Tax=Ilumatobacter nonamiensis TaxID=467093 RepID=UPI0003461C26|nr:iron chelate uptake ABC transporter family permease subunit [Ilumatobacter nonamiensis]